MHVWMYACMYVFPQKENNRKYFVAYFIARGNDPNLSMCVCNSININGANGYFNDAMVHFF